MCALVCDVMVPSVQDAEFDLACSQEWGEGGEGPPHKRKVSVANKSIMV